MICGCSYNPYLIFEEHYQADVQCHHLHDLPVVQGVTGKKSQTLRSSSISIEYGYKLDYYYYTEIEVTVVRLYSYLEWLKVWTVAEEVCE